MTLVLTMLEQALANVMNLGLNCRQVIGPVCFPSNKATFMPLSAFHTWIFPSSEPGEHLLDTGQALLMMAWLRHSLIGALLERHFINYLASCF